MRASVCSLESMCYVALTSRLTTELTTGVMLSSMFADAENLINV